MLSQFFVPVTADANKFFYRCKSYIRVVISILFYFVVVLFSSTDGGDGDTKQYKNVEENGENEIPSYYKRSKRVFKIKNSCSNNVRTELFDYCYFYA